MQQTPIHDRHNPDLLRMIPHSCKRIVEIGCSSGALAREFKNQNKHAHWIGIEIDPSYAALADRFCDKTIVVDIETCTETFYDSFTDRDCWVFGDTLEHLKDPWSVLGKIRNVIPPDGSVVVCVPNAQHWSLIVRMAIGDFRYQDSGLLDRTHLRWFTRKTLIEMFNQQGFKIVNGFPRVFKEQASEIFLPLIAGIARANGSDPDQAIKDALPIQYVLCAVPSSPLVNVTSTVSKVSELCKA